MEYLIKISKFAIIFTYFALLIIMTIFIKNKYQKNAQQNNKKRKINNILMQNNTKTSNIRHFAAKINKNNISYKQLKKTNNNHLFIKYINEKHKTFVEQKNYKLLLKLFEIYKNIKPTINKNTNKYRYINKDCFIESIASSFSYSILIKENFNIFQNFQIIASKIKIYKKEAVILKNLIIVKLIDIYLTLQKDIYLIKSNINKGAKAKSINNNQHPAFIYGSFLFNQSSTKIFIDKKDLIIKSTTKTLNDLDHIYYKQRIIFNYIKYLSENIR